MRNSGRTYSWAEESEPHTWQQPKSTHSIWLHLFWHGHNGGLLIKVVINRHITRDVGKAVKSSKTYLLLSLHCKTMPLMIQQALEDRSVLKVEPVGLVNGLDVRHEEKRN